MRSHIFLFGSLPRGRPPEFTAILNVRILEGSDSNLCSRLALPVRSPSPRKRLYLKFPTIFRTATAPGSEVLFPFEVVHLARSRVGSAPASKGLFSRCVENVSRYESFVRLYSFFFFWPFSFRKLREYLLVIYLNSFWHKTSVLFIVF